MHYRRSGGAAVTYMGIATVDMLAQLVSAGALVALVAGLVLFGRKHGQQ